MLIKKSIILTFLSIILLLVACSSESIDTKTEQICGGIQGLSCDAGYLCLYDGNYPDAQGICITQTQMQVVLANSDGADANQASNPIDSSVPSIGSEGHRTPYYDKAMLALSATGDNWELTNNNLVEHASVPDATILHSDVGDFTAGTIMSVFVYMSENTAGVEELGMIYSTDDGTTWSDMQILTLDSPSEHIAVDPSIIQLDDGTLMIHYFDFARAKVVGDSDEPYYMYALLSNDGLSYALEDAPAYTSQTSITDPDVIYFNGLWYMYFVSWEEEGGSSSIHVATGETPYSFTFDSDTQLAGIPGSLINQDGELEIYGCNQGITRSTSVDAKSFELQGTFSLQGCDPAPVQLGDGSYLMVLKGFADGVLS